MRIGESVELQGTVVDDNGIGHTPPGYQERIGDSLWVCAPLGNYRIDALPDGLDSSCSLVVLKEGLHVPVAGSA
jgi:hypothetical protein